MLRERKMCNDSFVMPCWLMAARMSAGIRWWVMRLRMIAIIGFLVGILALLQTPAAALAGTTERVSVDNAGNQGNAGSSGVGISGDGRFVVFTSSATNLVPGDTNSVADVFVRVRP